MTAAPPARRHAATHRRGGRAIYPLTGRVIVWLAGLAAGLYAVLTIAAHFNCASGAHGLACRSTGPALGGGLVLAVIVTVGVATIAVSDARSLRDAALRLLGGLAVLAVTAFAAHALIATA